MTRTITRDELMAKLKPCPFCGEDALSVEDDPAGGVVFIDCHACGMGAWYQWSEDFEKIADAWNRRVES